MLSASSLRLVIPNTRLILKRAILKSSAVSLNIERRLPEPIMPPKRKRNVIPAEESAQISVAVDSSPELVTRSEGTGRVLRKRSMRVEKMTIPVDTPLPDVIDTGNESPLTDLEDEEYPQEVESTPKKRRRRKKDLEPVVYDIPPVENKETSFRGPHPTLEPSELANGFLIRSPWLCLPQYCSSSAQTRPCVLLQNVSQRYYTQERT